MSLFFNLNAFAFDYIDNKIFIPTGTHLLSNDESAATQGGHSYKLRYVHFKDGKNILLKKHKINDTEEKLISSLLYSYRLRDINEIKPYFTPKAFLKISKNTKEKNVIQFDILSALLKPKVYFAYNYKGGVVISWGDSSFVNKRMLFIKKFGSEFKVDEFHSGKKDKFFWNVNLYMASAPFETFTPQVVKGFKEIKDGESKKLSFKLNKKNNYVHLFKGGDKKINLSLKDNYTQKGFPLNDISPEERVIEVNLKGEHFRKKGKFKLYYLESSYPMTLVTKDMLKKCKSIEVIKK